METRSLDAAPLAEAWTSDGRTAISGGPLYSEPVSVGTVQSW